jgi:protein-tyrosine phosphatase
MAVSGAAQGSAGDAGSEVARAAVLFVCMGNICRSPLAEGVFRTLVGSAGLQDRIAIDSAGTHNSQVGQPADARAVAVARRHGYELPPHRARKVGVADFARFDWILAMDTDNLSALKALRPIAYRGHLGLLLAMKPASGLIEVPDPYYGGPWDFERALELVERGAGALLEVIRGRLGTSGPL